MFLHNFLSRKRRHSLSQTAESPGSSSTRATTELPATQATMPAPRKFPWELVSQVKDEPTMEKLVSACGLGRDHAIKSTHPIRQVEQDDGSFPGIPASDKRFLSKCLADIESLASKYEEKEVLVGVSGATGAGKSSLLNALLDLDGLLPSSDRSASTATICEVAYNWNDDPDYLFRADICFRDKGDVRRELVGVFRDLQARKDLVDGGPDDEGDGRSHQVWVQAIKDYDDIISCGLDRIFAVWGKTRHELVGMCADDLLQDDDDPAMKFVGAKNLTVHSRNISDFSAKIRCYLDSSQGEMAAERPEGEAQAMSLWPLIKKVKLWVKADLLKGGLVLVDLPGLSDVVGARAQLAEEYYGKLSVTLIVTPIVRGADEITGVNLMTKNQALNMKMDGKFDHKSFCVVLSKADVLDWPKSDPASMPMHNELTAKGRGLDADIKEKEKEIKRLRKERDKSKRKPENEDSDLNAQIKKLNKDRTDLKRRKKYNERTSKRKFGQASFNYRQAREKPLFKRISRILRQEHDSIQETSQRYNKSTTTDFKVPNIFPVGTKAYWDLKAGEYVEGFPDPRYTGIPALRQWLKEVSIPSREKATVTLLKEYQAFYNSLWTWASNPIVVERVKLSAEELEAQIVNPMHEELNTKFEEALRKLERGLWACNPLRGYTDATNTSRSEVHEEVEKWALRYPDDGRLEPLNHMTFAAIVRRLGGPYTSNSGGERRFYHWMGNLAAVFHRQILDNWVRQFHFQIPKKVELFHESVDNFWAAWDRRFRQAIHENSPGIGSNRLAEQSAKLCVIKDKFKNRVSKTVGNFVAEGPNLRANVVDEVSAFWQPAFIAANSVRAGSGVTSRKKDVLMEFSRRYGHEVFQVPVAAVDQKLRAGLDKIRPGFDHALRRLQANLRQQNRLFTQKVTQARTTTAHRPTRIWRVVDLTQDGTIREFTRPPREKTPREKLMEQVLDRCSEWSEEWHGQNFENLGDTPDESVPLRWPLEVKIRDTNDSGSDFESDSEFEQEAKTGAVKLEEDAVMADVSVVVKEEHVVPAIKEEYDADDERYLVS